MRAVFPSLEALKAGDIAAWDAAFRVLWPIALRAAQHPEACLVGWESEDAASEAIVDLVSRIHTVQSEEEAGALVATISFRRAISLARRKFAAKRRVPEQTEEGSAGESLQHFANLSEIEQREMVGLTRQALDILDAETRVFLVEKIEQGLTYEEISNRHNVPLGTVCTKVARGLEKVRNRLRNSPMLMKELMDYLR